MNVVIYARYSSHNQTEQSIDGQLKECYDYCKRNDYTVIEEYIDEALSGTTDKRPAFLRMIKDSEKKHFQFIIVYQLDRFARNRFDSATYKARLKKNGVRVLSARENISDDASGILMESVLEGMAEYYSAELKQKVTRGMDMNAEKGLSTGGNIALGYVTDKDRHFQVDPDTAPIVQKVFELYADGKTVTEITEHLNAQGYRTSRGVHFNKNSLHTMLKNKRYIGVYTYKGTETPGLIPRIITDELFYKVSEIMEKNRKAPARARAKVEYLLTTRLFCGLCKEMMTGFSATGKQGKTYNYYICNGRKKKLCDKKMVDKDYIENLVVSKCRELLTDENIQKIAEEVVAMCEAERDTSNLKRLKKLLSENERKHKNALDAIMECDIESVRKSLYGQVPKLEGEHTTLEKEIAIEEKSQPSLSVPKIKFFLTALKNGNVNDMKYRRTLICVFINKIYLYDDKMTFIFNSGDESITIDDVLLSAVEKDSTVQVKNLFLNSDGPPKF